MTTSDSRSAAQTPELIKLAGRAMQNDPDSSSGELVRAWKALKAENRRLRTLIEQAAAEANHGELTDGTLASMTEVSEGA